MASEVNQQTGFRIRHLRNQGYYNSTRESWTTLEFASLFATLQNAKIIYDKLSRSPKLQTKIEIVTA